MTHALVSCHVTTQQPHAHHRLQDEPRMFLAPLPLLSTHLLWCVTWLLHMWYDSFTYDITHSHVTWLIHMWHDSFTCDTTHSHVTWLINVWPWLIHMFPQASDYNPLRMCVHNESVFQPCPAQILFRNTGLTLHLSLGNSGSQNISLFDDFSCFEPVSYTCVFPKQNTLTVQLFFGEIRAQRIHFFLQWNRAAK